MPESVTESQAQIAVIAGAEAIYRISAIASFDPSLRNALRQEALATLSQLVGVPLSLAEQRMTHARSCILSARRVSELIRLAETLSEVHASHAERILRAYARVTEYAQDVVARGEVNPEQLSQPHSLPHRKNISGLPANEVQESFRDTPLRLQENALEREIDGNVPDQAIIEPTERQKQIVSFLEMKGGAQIGEIRDFLGSEISEKTVQRDLNQLTELEIIEKCGDNRWTRYVSLGHSEMSEMS